MRPSLSLKTLLRAPFKAFMTFLLIATASFALFSRVADYAVTQREMERATSYYRGVAALDNGIVNTSMLLGSQLPNVLKYSYYRDTHPWPTALTEEQMNAFSTLPGVSSVDIRYMTSGIMKDYERVVDYGSYRARNNYINRFVLEGTYTGYTPDSFGGSKTNKLQLTDCKLLAGNIQLEEGSDTYVVAFAEDGSTIALTSGGKLVLFQVLYKNPYGQSFVDSLNVGDRCLFIGRYRLMETAEGTMVPELFVGDQDTIEYCDSFILLNGKPDNYLETEEFAKIRTLIDITNRDLNTFDMVYTSDMMAIPRFNEGKMEIKEGRPLSKEDTNSCVANLMFMEINGLEIGDKLTVELCDELLEQNGVLGAVAVIPERYGTPVKTVELEIVGAYLDIDAQYERDGSDWWCYSPNTLFVPTSLLPVQVPDDYRINPGEFSVVIDDAGQIEAFLEKAEPIAKDMGITLRFSDKGWLKVNDNIKASRSTSLITTALYLSAAVVALLLAVYLYIGRQKKSYAIMRALGTPRDKSRRALSLPLLVLSAVAIPVGGFAGMIYASGVVTSVLENLAATIEHYIPDTSLPIGVMIGSLFVEVGILLLFIGLFLRKLENTPPLTLLQGNTEQGKEKKKKKAVKVSTAEDEAIPSFDLSMPIVTELPEQRGYTAVRHVTRYILRHMRRAGWKTALTILLAMLLTGAMGLLAVTRLSYEEMFDKTEVTGTANNYSSRAVMEAQKSELMKDFYYSGEFFVIVNDTPHQVGYRFVLSNNLDRYLKSVSTEEYSVEYASGYDSSLFTKNVPQCLLGKALADFYGVKPGDTMTLLSWQRYNTLSTFSESEDELKAQLMNASMEFQVAGVIASEDKNIEVCVFAPLSENAQLASEYIEYPFPVDYCEYRLVDKEDPDKLRSYLEKLASDDTKYPDIISYSLDTTELDNVKRVRDMLRTLFPIAAAGAILIGLIAPILIIMQSAKEASLLRILGTTKRRTRCILALEQFGLSILGLMLATLGLILYNAGLFLRSAGTLLLCGGLYLLGCSCASVMAAVSVTRRKVLELLQVKE